MQSKIYVHAYYNILDFDECTINNGGCTSNTSSCVVVCSNTPGSFQCICSDGYTLDTDMLTCIGKLRLFF